MNGDLNGEITRGTAESRDGTSIGWEQVGTGAPLLVLHGGCRAAEHYRAMAAALAQTNTVVLMDRRGRGNTPAPASSDIETIVDDVACVLAATGATAVFGHSAGALFALESAIRYHVDSLILYEPPLPNDTGIPKGWMSAFERDVAKGRTARAMLRMASGLEMGPPKWIPTGFLAFGAWISGMTRGANGAEILGLLRTLPPEIAAAESCFASAYSNVGARTLLIRGSDSPRYLRDAVDLLRQTIPDSTVLELDGQAHNAPDMTAPEAVAGGIRHFLTDRRPLIDTESPCSGIHA